MLIINLFLQMMLDQLMLVLLMLAHQFILTMLQHLMALIYRDRTTLMIILKKFMERDLEDSRTLLEKMIKTEESESVNAISSTQIGSNLMEIHGTETIIVELTEMIETIMVFQIGKKLKEDLMLMISNVMREIPK